MRNRTGNVLTIDVEDWYHCLDENPAAWPGYEDRVAVGVKALLDLFHAHEVRATFFVLGPVAEEHPELVRSIHEAGHEVASHGWEHRFVYRQQLEAFKEDVRRSIELLETITGQPIVSYRAPYFSITKSSLWALDCLRELGIEYDSSIFPVHNHRYGIPDAQRTPHVTPSGVREVPLSTYPLGRLNLPVAGGVYFRFLPYWLIRHLLRRLNARGEPIVFYLHPWEVDPGQPRIAAPAFKKFRHYYGLGRSLRKLDRLLGDFAFREMRSLDIGSDTG